MFCSSHSPLANTGVRLVRVCKTGRGADLRVTVRDRQIETGAVSKQLQIGDLAQSDFEPECNSADTEELDSLDNGPYPGVIQQIGAIEPDGEGVYQNTQHKATIWHHLQRAKINMN